MRIPGRVWKAMKKAGEWSNNGARRVIDKLRQKPEDRGEPCKGRKPKYRRLPPNVRR
jgi:hypothetical protein